jgi:1-deoxy-D-xylulose-5-phosphate synthase
VRVGLLESIGAPADVRRLSPEQCTRLAAECRDFLVQAVSRTGGHLGPNLGVVELTIALHRAFESPSDRILFDTGHQAYVHKMLTGRQAGFATLRQPGGLSGYPSPLESPHDLVENSHASTALSWADGLAKALQLRGEVGRHVVAVVGDGALTGGMCWEALNTIAASDRPVVVVINDNGRSYAPTAGGLAQHLEGLRTAPAYESTLDAVRSSVTRVPFVGRRMFAAMHAMKRGIKDALVPQAMFEDLGMKYIGPVDGHDVSAVEAALRRAKRFGGPVIVHCVTTKGFGYLPAENDEADCLHGVGTFDPVTGKVSVATSGNTWTRAFGAELATLGGEDPTVVAITAAMLRPVGLAEFAQRFPERTFDVGIAEQHAATSAAGLASAGMRPFVAVYATFLNRAFDQVLLDVALHRLPVTFVLDRAGITGDDGPSHHGMWDLAWLGRVPGLRVAAPRDAATLRSALREAHARTDGPSVVRFPKGAVGEDLPAVAQAHGVDLLHRVAGARILVVGVGPFARVAVQAARLAAAEGVEVTVADPRWVLPVQPGLVTLAAGFAEVVVLEDGLRDGGVGSAVSDALADLRCAARVTRLGLPTAFVAQGRREDILRQHGLGAGELAQRLIALAAVGEQVSL